MMGYSDDEVLIFAGRFADNYAKVYVSTNFEGKTFYAGLHQLVKEAIFDEIRNASATGAERAMRRYGGFAEVNPLPAKLIEKMELEAGIEAHRINDLIFTSRNKNK